MRAFDTLIVGMGCAGLKCADALLSAGRKSVAILADDPSGGTSRNAGSDKQTYYKLTLAGDEGDSTGEMARTLFEGGCVDGPHALCEAALSPQCFLRLCELGVPFPANRYGEYIGYRTDHDPRRRATSAGPLTSKMMAEALEASARRQGGIFLTGLTAIRILTENGRARGVLCLRAPENAWEAIACNHLVWATGGPAALYESACYPKGHFGMSGALFEAGAEGRNLTEWQYGLASVSPRWNVSGTYMQALPRFVSTNAKGEDAREFLLPGFDNAGDMLTSVFLKGYQWPFDARKVQNGSSRVDALVQMELTRARRVFLDYRENTAGFGFEYLSGEAREYLARAGALLSTPYERLLRMNAPAVAFYCAHGVDLARDRLEISLCAQHMNGGAGVDEWWETGVRNLYAVGEVAGTHGVYRPGGSALNAGQAGAARAARKISLCEEREPGRIDAEDAIYRAEAIADACLGGPENLNEIEGALAHEMSLYAAALREENQLARMRDESLKLLRSFQTRVRVGGRARLPALFRFRDALIARAMVLSAMCDYAAKGGVSRGSAVYLKNGGIADSPGADPLRARVQCARFAQDAVTVSWRDALPLPARDDFFENVWREYREGKW